LVGFGTQFLDGELDGLPDLVVTNGHVYDLSYQGRPYRMSPQYFRNLGGGRFEELGPQKSGDFFSQKLLGRGLARLDWNRDGREDFAVSHLNSAAALVLNDTPQADVGHYFAIQLRGTASNRDAIGTRIRIVTASNVLNEQLTAGDGYESSNQRQIIVGTGTERRVIQVEVRWLSGLVQAFGPFDSESEIMIVEGCPRVHKLSRKPLSSGLKR
ncbi:MAG: putative system TPR-repeat lipoprotein, partial [Planctomycetaceae bacterium]|nr:putative system TPR-repeat lipoprotein [Planctomycetaceae bacterium]